MTTPPRLTPVFAPVQDLFNRHVFGRTPVATAQATAAPLASMAPVEEEDDFEDLAQRVRNVGEW
jgi:hypothetical protein